MANIEHSPSPKQEPSFQPGPLTPQEIESLRQDRKESDAQGSEWLCKNSKHRHLFKDQLRTIGGDQKTA